MKLTYRPTTIITMGKPESSDTPMHWLLSTAIAFGLVGLLYLAGVILERQEANWTNSRQGSTGISTIISALITVEMLLEMVPALRAALWN